MNETQITSSEDHASGTGHTREPWTTEVTNNDFGGWRSPAQRVEIWAGDTLISWYDTDFNEYPNDETNKANSERIVSCVNALAGIKNPSAVPNLIREATHILLALENGEAQFPGSAFQKSLSKALAALDTPVPEVGESPVDSSGNPNPPSPALSTQHE